MTTAEPEARLLGGGRRRHRSGGVFGRLLLMAALITLAGVAVNAVTSGALMALLRPDDATPVPPPGGPVRIALFGDSLATQAAPYFQKAVTANGRATLRMTTYPGTAICDWLPSMAKTARTFHPQAVVAEFSGNSLTPCMHDSSGKPRTGTAVRDKYQSDAERVMSIFKDPATTVYWIGPPPDRDAANSAGAAAIRSIYEALPSRYPNARYVDAAAAVLDNGQYADYLPCLPFEACLGPRIGGTLMNRVRSPDGLHFCPQDVPGNKACPVYSSGAFRFAAAMAGPLIADDHL